MFEKLICHRFDLFFGALQRLVPFMRLAKMAASITGLAHRCYVEFSLSVLLCFKLVIVAFISNHRVFLAHFKDATILHQFFNEGAFIFKIVNHIILEVEEKGQPVLKRTLHEIAGRWLVKLGVRLHSVDESVLLAHQSVIEITGDRPSDCLVQDDNRQHMACALEMVSWGVYVHIFQQLTQTSDRSHGLLHLKLKLLNLVILSFQLAIEHEEVG